MLLRSTSQSLPLKSHAGRSRSSPVAISAVASVPLSLTGATHNVLPDVETAATCSARRSGDTVRRLYPGWPNGPVTGSRFCGLPPTIRPSCSP